MVRSSATGDSRQRRPIRHDWTRRSSSRARRSSTSSARRQPVCWDLTQVAAQMERCSQLSGRRRRRHRRSSRRCRAASSARRAQQQARKPRQQRRDSRRQRKWMWYSLQAAPIQINRWCRPSGRRLRDSRHLSRQDSEEASAARRAARRRRWLRLRNFGGQARSRPSRKMLPLMIRSCTPAVQAVRCSGWQAHRGKSGQAVSREVGGALASASSKFEGGTAESW